MPTPETSAAPAPAPPAPPSPAPPPPGVWARAPLWVRLGLLALVAVVLGAVAWPRLSAVTAAEAVTPEDRAAAAARERAMWDAMLRLSPTPLAPGALVAETLGPGDAERADGRYAAYYAFDADSVAFSVRMTSAAFAPDLSVVLPDGRAVAASALLATGSRAEVTGLVGPGRFEVVATSRDPGQTGPYELSVLGPEALPEVEVDGEARFDTLGRGPRRAGRYERALGIVAEPDVPVVVRVASAAFRPRVTLIGPNGVVRSAGTVEQVAEADSAFSAVVRYLPGFEAPYRLEVTSEAPGATGPFAVEAQSLPVRALRPDGTAARATLGPRSWLEAGRYIDVYRVTLGEARAVRLEASSRAFPPAFRLWKLDRQDRAEAADRPNGPGAGAVAFEGDLEAGEYLLEVSSGGDDEDQPLGGEYVVRLEGERAPPPAEGGPAVARQFATEVRRVGESGGDRFEVGVTYVALSYPAGSRTRVQLSVTVRSVDYTGSWAPWESFARQAYLVDDAGRRYVASVAESESPSGPRAEPGTARRGTVVFYHPAVVGGQKRLVFVASVGAETVTLPIPVE